MDKIANLLQIEANCRNCHNDKELSFVIVNETRGLLEYDQAVLIIDIGGNLKVEAISDVTIFEPTSPYVQWIESLSKRIKKLPNHTTIQAINLKDSQTQHHQQKDYSPPYLLWVPLNSTKYDPNLKYYLLLFKNQSWYEDDKAVMEHLSTSYGHFLYALRKCELKSWISKSKTHTSKYFLLFVIAFVCVMFVPISLTVLAPCEVQAKDPLIVTSPLNGAIDKVLVTADQVVKEGDLLFKIKEDEFLNNYTIANKTLQIAQAQLHTVEQSSFVDYKQKSQIPNLQAEVSLKTAEMEYAKDQYEKTKVYAKTAGIVIVNDPNSLNGKPVVVGEKIVSIADKNSIELKIMLPVGDAIFLSENTNINIFFDNDPLNTWNGKVSQIYYEPELTPQGILSYKIVADFASINQHSYTPKIGLRGTAKIYSQEVTLFFYLFRKPITSIRQWIGW